MAILILKFKNHLLFFFLFNLLQLELLPQAARLDFENFSIDQGLSTPMIQRIYQDRTGFLWFCTWNGLYRYDGYIFVSYKHDPDDISSINNSTVNHIYEDKKGILWIGTWHGLEKFDRTTGRFIHYIPDPSKSGSDASDCVWAIREDKYDVLWVGTSNGLNKFDRTTGKFTCIRYDSTDPGSITNNAVHSIYEDETGSLWFGTGGGLCKLDFKTGKFKHYWNDSSNREKIWVNNSKYWINAIYGDNNGSIWLGTNGGLVEFNQKSGMFSTYLPNPNEKQILKDNCVTSICQDESGMLWLGTRHLMYAFDIKSKEFIGYDFYDNNNPISLEYNEIFSAYVEQSGTLWLGTWSGGANKFKLKVNPFKKYLSDRSVHGFIKDKEMLFILTSKGWIKFNPASEKIIPCSFGIDNVGLIEDSGDLWARDLKKGLYKRDIRGNITYFYDRSGKRFNKLITRFCKTNKGFWIGTEQLGLYFLDLNTQLITEVYKSNLAITQIFEDSFGLVWVGTLMGKLLCFNQKYTIENEFISDPKVTGSISGRQIRHIHEDKNGRLWFATNVGLNRFDRLTKRFTHFDEKDGLLDNDVYYILEDDHGYLWISTNKGFSKFYAEGGSASGGDPEKKLFQNFYVSLGTPPSRSAAIKTANGEMYFPADVGFIRFHPDSVKLNPFIPPIVITSFKKFDKTYPFGKEIRLPYDENFISFEYAALSFINSERNNYAYKMEGIDKDWVYAGTRRFASYPNLNPGEYIFRVKGSNNDGVWNEAGTSISIIISPPWWKTWWAYTSYAGLFIIVLYGIRRYEHNRADLKNKIILDEAVLKEREEADKMKSRFFANISHEFRTPLTLILSPAKQMAERSEDYKVREELNTIHKNASRLLRLVNQLLDISKLESGNMKLYAAPSDLIALIKTVMLYFCSYAERKKINLKFNSSEESVIAYIDKEKIEKIFLNILSNAFKFTPEEGSIEVIVDRYSCMSSAHINCTPGITEFKECVSISVTDSGIGIPKDKLSKIFDRFYQVDNTNKREHEGTGIGLALTKELVELHRGRIEVESLDGSGTKFTVYLPLGKNHLAAEEIFEDTKTDNPDFVPEGLYAEEPDLVKQSCYPHPENGKPILLLIEDNCDVRNYLKSNLQDEFTIFEAANGLDGWKISEIHLPDLIVSDIMMPGLDGFELCTKIKNDERTSHIPVILLTAKAAAQDKIEGLNLGADEYIMKPFEPDELKARIRNLIEQRKRIHEHFRKHGLFEIDEKSVAKADKCFLQKVMDKINEHVSDHSLNVEMLIKELAVSRSVLQRKLLSLTGETPGELIRRVRLKKAAVLIEQNFGNISEIALEVGFNNPAHFSEAFKKQFGLSPFHYHQKFLRNNSVKK